MNTFLTSYNLEENAECLDPKRKFKQLLEGYQLLNSIVGNGKGWQNHPARLSWVKNPISLFRYIKSIWDECQSRGIAKNSQLYDKSLVLIDEYISANPNYIEIAPDWWGRLDIIKSHKARLYSKGEIDAYCAAIKKEFKIKSIDKWLKEKFKKTKNELRWADLTLLKDFIFDSGRIVDIKDNHYAQFGWQNEVDFNPGMEYVWPVSKN
jgi:hypothetical protein